MNETDRLLQKIRLGEDTSLELKSVTFRGKRISGPKRDDLADEIAAMANTHDATLVLGVDDKSREISGIPPDRIEAVERYVYEICNESIKPPVVFRSLRLELPDNAGALRVVLAIEIPRSLFVHESAGGYFHRQGSSKRKMPPDLLARLFQQRSQTRLIRFDEQVVANASPDDLTPKLVDRFQTGRTRNDVEDLLVKLGMAREDDVGVLRPTVAGVLLATKDPRTWLPNAFVQAVAYRGTSVVPDSPRHLYQLDAQDITGPADEQILEACRFVHRNMKVMATKHVGRRDIPQYDITAVFEAVVNAVTHRDYSMQLSKIRLRVFADRLELYSPGALANTMTVDALPYRVATRNEALAGLLAHCLVPPDLEWLKTDRRTFTERRGEGVRIILESSEALSGKRPEYRLIDDTELLLTIHAAQGPPQEEESDES